MLSIKGDRWTVVKAKVHGKYVRLTIDGRHGSFTDDVKARTLYDVLVTSSGAQSGSANRRDVGASKTQPSGPLISPSGAQTRWATGDETRSIVPPAEASRTRDWDVPLKDERALGHLNARLVAVEVEGGKLVVPAVDDSTLLGHLVTMHGVRFDGLTVAEAKAWAKANDPGGDVTLEQVTFAQGLERARAVHDELHRDLTKMSRVHWHRTRAPK